MSTRAQRRRHEKQQSNAPKKSLGNTVAVIAAVVAMIAIIAYAVVQRNAQVSGAAVNPIAVPSVPPPAKVGTRAPDFSVAAKGGVISSAALAGKPYLLELFATWCPHCQAMTTVLRDLRRKFPPSRLAMVSVSAHPEAMDSTLENPIQESQSDVDAFDAKYQVTWPSVFDKDMSMAKTWGLHGYPTIFVVNARGTIVFSQSGEIDQKTLVAALKKAGA